MKLKRYELIKITLIGFILFYSFAYHLDKISNLEITNISNINNNDINKKVKINGEVIKINNLNTTTFIEIKDKTGNIKGVIFETNIFLNKNQKYLFEGKISMYKRNLELIIDEISIP